MFTHIEDGGRYALLNGQALLKHPETGGWLEAVIYNDVDPASARYLQQYVTTPARWAEKFREVEAADRGVGRTTQQMRDARVGAVFIWCNDDLEYPRALAARLNRRDLQIIGPLRGIETLYGRRRASVVVDHAVRAGDYVRLRPYIELAQQGAA